MNVSEVKVSYHPKLLSEIKITNSNDAYKVILNNWDIDTIEMQEVVKVMLFNRANYVIGIYELSKGGISSTTIDIKILMSVVLKSLASSIILVHNHPSGNLNPSEADISITKKIKEICDVLGIIFYDHLIISKSNFYSFSEKGKLK